MSRRLKVIIAYDGASFDGWQSQSHRNTVQDHLEHAFQQIGGAPVRLHGAGRTDAGVHALAQCAHVDVPNPRLTPERWTRALNACLPHELRVLRCNWARKDFHARFSSKGKVYRYRIWSGSVLPPLEFGRVWHLAVRPDPGMMTAAAAQFVGSHDFAGFAANRGQPETDTVRTMRSITVRCAGAASTLEIDGDGFLYKMVRLMVGAIVQCGTGKMAIKELGDRLRSRRVTSPRLAAPAAGLYLVRVRY